MHILLKSFKVYGIFVILTILSVFVFSLLVLFEKIPSDDKSLGRSIFFMGLVLFLILGFLGGNSHHKKGFITGFLYSFVIITIALLISFLGYEEMPEFKDLIKYAIFVISSVTGSIVGVNFKKFI